MSGHAGQVRLLDPASIALGHEMEGAFGHAFAGDGLSLAICKRTEAFAYKIACGSGRPARIGERDIGVGTEAVDVLLARAQSSMSAERK